MAPKAPLNVHKAKRHVGDLAFVIGVLVALIAGIATSFVVAYEGAILLALVVLGLVVGLINIGEKETTAFLVASIALIVTGTANLQAIDTLVSPLGTILSSIFGNIAVFVAPAALVVSVKAVWNLAKS